MNAPVHEPDSRTDALASLSLLETRLRRLEFLLTGSSDLDGKPVSVPNPLQPIPSKDTITGRLRSLQQDLDRLRKPTGPAGDLVRDIESLHSKTPEIFTDPTPNPLTSLSDQTTHIFANTPLYTETASRLSSLQTLQIPPADQSAQLISLQPRIDFARTKQEQLETQARELRERSARCLEWWVKIGVVEMGELWSDWEARVRDAERGLSRLERSRSERAGYV